jgi:RimJ/RimL family protein N-acetyltransferase
VRFQPLDERWLDDVAELVADPHVRRFTRIPEPPPQDFARSWIDRDGEGRRDGTCEGFAAVDGDHTFVGLALAPAIDRGARELELGYIVASGARGRGIATEILRLLTDWAFDAIHAERAFLVIDLENRASQRVAERCGYHHEGDMRSIYIKEGRRTDAGLWSRLPTDP